MAKDKTKDRDPFGSRYSKSDTTDKSSKTDETDEQSKTDKTEEPSKTGEDEQGDSPSKTEKSAKPVKTETTDKSNETAEKEKTSVKDRPSVLMYLPKEQHTELDIRFDELNVKYKRKHGESLQKNRDYYPILIELAMEKTQEIDEQELLDRLSRE